MSNLIVRAEKEVFLATNFWQNGVASKYITNAIRELSRRAGERGVKIVIKIIYDRGSPKQLFEPHCQVPETEYTGAAVGLPSSHDIPNVDLQVINYHRALLGTFHAKYMIVDRSIAVLQSNNIQDNDNLEMMVQLEGPVVDSMYDMALLSWHKQFEPPLPKLDSPAAGNVSGSVSFDESHASIFSPEGAINGYTAIVDGNKIPKGRAYGLEALWGGQLKRWSSQDSKSNASDIGSSGNSKPPVSNDIVTNGNGNGNGNEDDHSERDLETMTHTLPEHTTEDPHYDDTLAGEVQRVQASLIPKPGETSVQAVSRHLNHTVNKGFEGNAPPCDPRDEMTPYVPHPAHEPFPMALVCRAPYGTPNHASVANPQNAAWLSAMRNARESVFIQTPTLNAEPLIPAILEACERGVDVYCYVCLGYNDSVSCVYLLLPSIVHTWVLSRSLFIIHMPHTCLLTRYLFIQPQYPTKLTYSPPPTGRNASLPRRPQRSHRIAPPRLLNQARAPSPALALVHLQGPVRAAPGHQEAPQLSHQASSRRCPRRRRRQREPGHPELVPQPRGQRPP